MTNFSKNKDPETPNFTKSTYETVKGTHRLEIQGFSLTKGMGAGKSECSDTFFVGGHLWQIRFYPEGYLKVDKSGQVYVSCYIALVSKCEGEIRACFEFVLLDKSGNKWHKQSDTKFAVGPHMSAPCMLNNTMTVWGFRRFYKRTELEASRFIRDGCLTIQCNVGVVKTSINVFNTFAQSLPLSNLRRSYQLLLESGEGSDVSFEVEGERFYAHKLILSTRSPVFRAQFFGSLKEEKTRCIKIEEMQAPVFKIHKSLSYLIALLHFIYCDVILNLDSKYVATMMTQHLLVAADRYGIESLRSLCELRLCKNIAVNTVASSLVLAEQHGCSKLKSTCHKFIGLPKNLEAVIQTDGFKNLKESCPAVIDELLKSVAQVRDYSFDSYYKRIAKICNSGKKLLVCFLPNRVIEDDANKKRVKTCYV